MQRMSVGSYPACRRMSGTRRPFSSLSCWTDSRRQHRLSSAAGAAPHGPRGRGERPGRVGVAESGRRGRELAVHERAGALARLEREMGEAGIVTLVSDDVSGLAP